MKKDTRNAAGFALTVSLMALLLGGCGARQRYTLEAQAAHAQDSAAACVAFYGHWDETDAQHQATASYCSKYTGSF